MRRPGPLVWVGLVLAWVAVGYVVDPLGELVRDSFTSEGAPGFTLANYVNFLDLERFRYAVPLLNSFLVAIPVVVLTALLGTALAVLFTRYEFPGRDLLHSLAITPLVMPGFISAYVCLMVYGRFGLIARLWTIPFGLTHAPFYLDGYWGVVLVETVAELPLAFLTISAVLARLDVSLEEAALSLGASWTCMFRRALVPIVLPGILAGAMLTFVTSVAELSTTMLLYTPSTMTIPIAIYIQVYNTDLGLAAVLGLVQIAVVVLALLVVNRTVGIRALRRPGAGAQCRPGGCRAVFDVGGRDQAS